MISAHNLSYKINKNTLFSGLNFDCKSGNIFQILGSNGSGKTSLLKILSGITNPTKGMVTLKGSIRKLYLGHKIPIKDYLTSEQNYYLLNGKDTLKDYDAYCDLINLNVPKSMLSANLSFGQKKKLILSKIFNQSYDILFLDKPFVGLDAETVMIIKKQILEMKKKGAGIFLTSHQETLEGDVLIDLDKGEIS